MKNVDYNELLYEKVSQELKDFISELKSKTAEAVIEYAYELTIKEDIVCVFECIDFTQEEAKSLYEEQYPLDGCYQEWLHNDQSYMDIITQTVQDKIKSSVNKRRKMNIRTLYANEIECRIGMVNEKGLSLLLYKNARVDMQILDECFGIFGWQRQHTCIEGNLYCTIQIKDPETQQWIAKEDVGVSGYTEKEKSQASDAFKRAAVNIGIGRELYSAPFIWIPASKVTIQRRGDKFCCYDHFKVSSISYNDKKEIVGLKIIKVEDNSTVYEMRNNHKTNNTVLSDSQVRNLYSELNRTGVDINSVFKRYGINSIEEMSYDTFSKAMNSLRKTKDKIHVA